MSEFKNTAETISWSAASMWVKLLVVIGLITVMAAVAVFAVNVSANRPLEPGNVAQVNTLDSRMDDYGLRHPDPFGRQAQDSRMLDYGLRHPDPFGRQAQDSRLDDHGLRHPDPFGRPDR